ncbi:hypothetical protein M5689_017773 [Euphorbia peplus]|nr:hypothetical protein M5689_017773 [Euphorbia peplus]
MLRIGVSLHHQEDSEKEIEALRTARHSVGRPRKVFMKRSSMGSTVATPTSLHSPSPFNLSPCPLRITPLDSSDVNTVFTSRGGALYKLPTENRNFAVNSRSTYERYARQTRVSINASLEELGGDIDLQTWRQSCTSSRSPLSIVFKIGISGDSKLASSQGFEAYSAANISI